VPVLLEGGVMQQTDLQRAAGRCPQAGLEAYA
jgi:hypothetical protein